MVVRPHASPAGVSRGQLEHEPSSHGDCPAITGSRKVGQHIESEVDDARNVRLVFGSEAEGYRQESGWLWISLNMSTGANSKPGTAAPVRREKIGATRL